MEAKTQLTTETGIPVGDNQTNLTPGSRGPCLPRLAPFHRADHEAGPCIRVVTVRVHEPG
jgi:hypothetical protein